MASIHIATRPALPTDLPQIHAIQVHYVEHTVMNFSYVPASLDEMRTSYEEVLGDGFPYLVAMSSDDKILGYAYAHPFRTRAAYEYTAELSIFVRPDVTNNGVGGVLLKDILQALHDTRTKSDENERRSGKAMEGSRQRGHNIHRLLACMTVDPEGDQAEKLRRFYEKFGFKEVARLEKIGRKNGMWLDTRYMQRDV